MKSESSLLKNVSKVLVIFDLKSFQTFLLIDSQSKIETNKLLFSGTEFLKNY